MVSAADHTSDRVSATVESSAMKMRKYTVKANSSASVSTLCGGMRERIEACCTTAASNAVEMSLSPESNAERNWRSLAVSKVSPSGLVRRLAGQLRTL